MGEQAQPLYPPSVLQLAALPNAVSSARRHTRDVLRWWGYSALLEACELLVSELVTNAIIASGITSDPTTFDDRYHRLCRVQLRLVATTVGVLIEVWDNNAKPPALKDASPDDESGRGLLIVERLSARWNVYFPRRGGKVVWCEVQQT